MRPTPNVNSGKPTPNVNGSRPSLNKPARDSISKGNQAGRDSLKNTTPNVNSASITPNANAAGRPSPNVNTANKPSRDANVKPSRANDPNVIKQFTPGRLNSQTPNVNSSKGWDKLNDPEVVKGPRNRDVKGGDAPPRERVYSDKYGYHNDDIIKSHPSSCGHSFCGGHGGCVYAYDYCDPVTYYGGHGGHGWYDDDNWGFSFSFGYSSGYWGIGVGVGYNAWYDDCNYYRPYYSYYAPSWGYYNNWCAPAYYYTPYYHRPYYSLRYSYGCYTPPYWYYDSYYPYRATSTYWWLYDGSPSYSYDEGYESGFVSGYEAGTENASDNYGGYQPTWLGGGAASQAGATTTELYVGADREVAAAADGWDLLVAGNAREARRAFDQEAMNAPGDGLPQIGYAVTAGLMERYDEAIAAMRKAVSEDPDAFAETPNDPRVHDAMRNLLTHYRNVTREKADDVSALFMTAALRHLLGENALAYFAANRAIEAGDAGDSTRILKDLIQRALDAETDAGRPKIPSTSYSPAPQPNPPAATAPTTSSSPRQF